MKCSKCFKETDVLFGDICPDCFNLEQRYPHFPMGWICPKCNCVNSPDRDTCAHCNPDVYF